MQIKFIRLSGDSSMMIPKAIISSPKARSYWNASRYRSFEKYPTSRTRPNTMNSAPHTMPITDREISGTTISKTPNTHSRTDMMM